MTVFSKTSISLPPEAGVAAITPDGRLVSYAIDDQNSSTLFVTDLTTDATTTIISVAHVLFGAAVFSPDGHHIYYTFQNSSGAAGSYITDLSSNGPPLKVSFGKGDEWAEAIANDGRHVIYKSYSGSVVDPPKYYLRDVVSGEETFITQEFNDEDFRLTPDGHFASYLALGNVTHSTFHVFDALTHVTESYGDSNLTGGGLSDDGRYVAYESAGQVYVHDRQNPGGADILVSANASGSMADATSKVLTISGDGRHVAFYSKANNLVPNDTDGDNDIFIKNLDTGAVSRVDTIADVTSGGRSELSYDGTVFSFGGGSIYKSLPPSISINQISDGYINSLEAEFPVTVSGTSDAIGRTVHITSPNGSTATALVKADGTWTAAFVDATGVAEGIRKFTADVVDADSGLHGTVVKSVDFDYTPPFLGLYNIAGDNIVSRRELSAITIDGVSDAFGHQVSLSIDHHFIGKALVSPTGDWNFVYDGTNLSDGQHEIEFSTDDDAGNVTDRSIFFDKVTPHNVAPTFFVGGGFVVTPVGPFGGGFGTGLVIRPDGDLVVAGYALNGILGDDLNNFAEVSYRSDGHLDTAFGNGGSVIGTKGVAISVALQADKTIVAGGIGPGFGLERFNADGTVDTTFGSGGVVKTHISDGFDSAMSVVVDGTKIIAAGSVHPTSENSDFALVRYLADGSLDPTFGNGGIVTTDFGSPNGNFEGATSVKVQADHKIVVCGWAETSDFNGVFALARYNPDGTLDSNFGTGGKVTTSVGVSSTVNDIQLLADGTILAVGIAFDGSSEGKVALVRYTSSGALDTSFGGTGKVLTFVDNAVNATSVVVQPDGKILVGGSSLISPLDANASHQFTIVRYNANGSLDTTFGDAGVVFTQVGGVDDPTSNGMSIRLQADGKIVLAGDSLDHDGVHGGFAIARYNPDGSLDPTFGGTNSLGNAVSFTEDGDPVVLDETAKIFDADLARLDNGAGNYGGASVTLARSGGANADDVFGASGGLTFAGSNAVLAGVTVGAFAQSGGQLDITFADGATQAQVNAVLDAITYTNSHVLPPARRRRSRSRGASPTVIPASRASAAPPRPPASRTWISSPTTALASRSRPTAAPLMMASPMTARSMSPA